MELKKTGYPIPENDLWIAATCLELDIPLLTMDGHFDYVQDLRVINTKNMKKEKKMKQ